MSMSLDGYVTGPHDSREHPLGEGGEVLHRWLGQAGTQADHAVLQEKVDGAAPPVFTFVTDGIESAIAQAKAAAGHRAVGLHGATAAQQALAAGLLDEVQVHLVPVLLGGGVRLFDLLGANPVDLVRDRVIEAGSGVTHLRFRVPR
jgi:dihydrofolate reductase